MNVEMHRSVRLAADATAEISINTDAPFGVLLLVKAGGNVMTYTMLSADQASELGSALMGGALHAGRAAERAGGWHS